MCTPGKGNCDLCTGTSGHRGAMNFHLGTGVNEAPENWGGGFG